MFHSSKVGLIQYPTRSSCLCYSQRFPRAIATISGAGMSSNGFPGTWRSISHFSEPEDAKFSSVVNSLLTKLRQNINGDIRSVLDNEQNLMLRSDNLFWEPLLKALNFSSSRTVQQVLEWKMEKLVKEGNRDPRDWARQICLAGRVNNAQLAAKAFTLMELQEIRPNAIVFNSLIYAYGFSNELPNALSLFEVMERTEDCRPTLVTYNTLMSIYSHLGDAQNLQSWYEACKRAGFSPNAETFKYLIVGFIRANRYDKMDSSFREMISSGVSPSMPTLEAVMEGYCKQCLLDRAKETLKFMLDEGWTVNELIARNLFVMYDKLGRVQELEELLGVARTLRNSKFVSEVHSKIVKAYAFSGHLDDMEFSVGRMLEEGRQFTHPRDVEVVIQSYFHQEAYDRLQLFLNRIKEVYNLTLTTYDLLLTGYAKVGQYNKLQQILQDMKEADLSPSIETCKFLQHMEQAGIKGHNDFRELNGNAIESRA